jgi:hypothetical protein
MSNKVPFPFADSWVRANYHMAQDDARVTKFSKHGQSQT